MILYHGTQNRELKELRTDFKSGRKGDTAKIYLTDNYEVAFLYATNTLRFYSYDKDNDILWFREVAPDSFKKMYKGHGCYIFKTEIDNPEPVDNHPIGKHIYSYDKNIKLDKKDREYISDCYEKLLQLEKDGKIKLYRWEDRSEEDKEKDKEKFIKQFLPYMKETKEKYPLDYKMLTSFYSELAVDDNNESEDKKIKVAIVGAGASGLMLGGLLTQKGFDVAIFDHNEKAGKKLYISGKGRCNLTNLCSPDEFLKNVVNGEKFVRSAIYNFTSADAVQFFEELGLKTKVERGNRVFPQSDKSSDVIKVLKEKHCKDVKFQFDNRVLSIEKINVEENYGKDNVEKKDSNRKNKIIENNVVENNIEENNIEADDIEKDKFEESKNIFVLTTEKGKQSFDAVVIATGGKSYISTGSDGSGFKFAKSFGHSIVPLVPALCPIKLKNNFIKVLQGVSLKNVTLKTVTNGKKAEYFGEMMFTDIGITGPIVLTASSKINRADDVKLALDFKPALTENQLDTRLLRDFDENKNKEIKTIFRGLLPKVVAEVFAMVVGIDENRKVNSITKEERRKIIEFLKNFPLEFGGLYNLDAGIVTSGGVSLKEVNPKTFESKLVAGLYFIGEVLDVDALTGGFNLQLCWAEAVSCARNFV